MAGFEEQDRAIGEDVAGGGVVRGFDVAGSDDAKLLVGFVEVSFCDPERKVRDSLDLKIWCLVGEEAFAV